MFNHKQGDAMFKHKHNLKAGDVLFTNADTYPSRNARGSVFFYLEWGGTVVQDGIIDKMWFKPCNAILNSHQFKHCTGLDSIKYNVL